MGTDDRKLRDPPPQDVFDRIDIPEKSATLAPAIRLADLRHASQFFPSKRSRLTPISWRFPCTYLAESRRTSVAEVWGEKLYGEKKLGRTIFAIPASDATHSRFLKADSLPSLKICNATDIDVREKLGVDSGTLYAPALALPQTWAERIAMHPAKFDGIMYRSRPTDQLCLVLWNRPGGRDLEREIAFSDDGPFVGCPEAFNLAASYGLRLSFP